MNRISLKKKATFLFRGVVNTIMLNTIFNRQYDIRKTLVVAGTARSGSTWLAEIVSAHPEAIQIFEPISPTNVRAARKCGFTYDTYCEAGKEWPEGRIFLEKVLRGQVLTPWTTSQIPVSKTGKSRFLVVKFVRANLLLGWLTSNFPIKPPVLIIRHPCATIASQMHKDWIPGKKVLLSNRFFSNFPELKRECKQFNRPEELLAIRWCMRYYAPLSLPAPYPFHLLTYEGLVRHGEEEILRLFSRWGSSPPQESFALLVRPSKTVTDNSQVLMGRDPLSGWKRHLSEEQAAHILFIVRLFNLDFYSEALEPDYDRLQGLASGQERLPGLL